MKTRYTAKRLRALRVTRKDTIFGFIHEYEPILGLDGEIAYYRMVW